MKLVSLFVLILSITSFARPLTHEEKVSELESLAALIKSQYGPLEFKEKFQNMDLVRLLDQYSIHAQSGTNKDFYYLLNRFVAEFKDSHFRSSLQSNEVSFLGFFTDRVDGKVLIDEVDLIALIGTSFPFKKGDRLMSMNGVPVETIVTELGQYIGMGYEGTTKRFASMMLTTRPSGIFPAPQGTVLLEIEHYKGALETVELPWIHFGDAVENNRRSRMDYLDLSINDAIDLLPKSEKSFRCSGKTRINIPRDSTILMTTPFVAYYHPTSKGNIGYLRIPHYSFTNSATGESENDFRYLQYEGIVDTLEKNTVGLIIDQDHNCGGSVDMVERMAGLFAISSYKGLEFQFLSSRNEQLQFNSWLTDDLKVTLDGMDLLNILKLMKDAWIRGERLTPKTTFRNNRLLEPNTHHYTKPILMLIDEMSGSGGDAFPAMLQGMSRAKLFGTRTMGAGGHVVTFAPLNYSGNNLRMTKSMFYRPNGTPIENNGVVPDYAYTITGEDFMFGYQDYQKAYLAKLLEMIP